MAIRLLISEHPSDVGASGVGLAGAFPAGDAALDRAPAAGAELLDIALALAYPDRLHMDAGTHLVDRDADGRLQAHHGIRVVEQDRDASEPLRFELPGVLHRGHDRV